MEEVAVIDAQATRNDNGTRTGNGTKYTDEVHPYMKPEFWLDPNNQFWKKSRIFKQESYENIVVEAQRELYRRNKEDLIK